MSDSAGGRETEIEAVARALAKLHGDRPNHAMQEWGNRARTAIAALDAVRSSGSAARPTPLSAEDDEQNAEREWRSSGSAARNEKARQKDNAAPDSIGPGINQALRDHYDPPHHEPRSEEPEMSHAAQKPDIEIRRQIGPGHFRSYANVYYRPLRVWVLGHWIIGGRHVRAAWARVEADAKAARSPQSEDHEEDPHG